LDSRSPGPHIVVLRAAFVPQGADPPPEMTATMNPLRIPATLNPKTGELTCGQGIGAEWGEAIRAEWHPTSGQGDNGSRS
jgi:hypothetical protein